jgi:hypothetical protein
MTFETHTCTHTHTLAQEIVRFSCSKSKSKSLLKHAAHTYFKFVVHIMTPTGPPCTNTHTHIHTHTHTHSDKISCGIEMVLITIEEREEVSADHGKDETEIWTQKRR